jgi:O-antigen/teichoic acid export membrane protein
LNKITGKVMITVVKSAERNQLQHSRMQHIKSMIQRVRKDPHFSELLSGSSIALTLRVIGLIFGYGFTLLITRNFGADSLGIFALTTTILTIVSIVGKAGFDIALVRFISQFFAQQRSDLVKEVYYKALKIVIPLCISISLLLFIVAPFLSIKVFRREYLTEHIKIISIAVLPFVLININSQAFRGIKKVTIFSFFQYISNFLFSTSFLLLLIPAFSDKEDLPILAYVFAIVVGALLSQIFWNKKTDLGHAQTGDTLRTKSLLEVSIPMMLSDSMFFIMNWTTTIMLGIFRSDAEVGVFNAAVKISAFTGISLLTINYIAAPKFAELYGKGDSGGLRRIIHQSTKLIFWTSAPILILIFLFPKYILGLFGPEFESGWIALVILTLGQFVHSVSGSVGFILQMTGREKAFQYIISVASILSVLLSVAIIPSYGVIGAAIANTVSIGLWNILSVLYIKKAFGFLPLISR